MKNITLIALIVGIFAFIYLRIMRFKANLEKITTKISKFEFVDYRDNFKYLYFTFDINLFNPEKTQFKFSDLVIYAYLENKLIAVTGKTTEKFLITNETYTIKEVGLKLDVNNLLEVAKIDLTQIQIEPFKIGKTITIVKSFKINNIAIMQREYINI